MNNHTSFSDGSIPEGAFSPLPDVAATSATTTSSIPAISLPTPSTFSDEQALKKLDVVTREAIDERLKVLEDVQRKLWSAAEELKKVKSSLPPPAIMTTSSSSLLPTSLPVEGYVSAPESGYTSVVGRRVEAERMNELVSSVEERLGGVVMSTKGKGKGKERAVDDEFQFQSMSQLGSSSGATGHGQMRREGEDDLLMDALVVDPESGDVVQ